MMSFSQVIGITMGQKHNKLKNESTNKAGADAQKDARLF